MKLPVWIALALLLLPRETEALKEPGLCYILDGILFIYGIVLTFLYCRIKIQYRRKSKMASANIYEKVEGVYTGLSKREQEPYTTLELPKVKPREPPSPEQETMLE